MPGINLESYHKSISEEFKVCQNRVRNIIGEIHWGEDGRYKEIILMNILRRYLPKHISVGTGFILCSNGGISKQIDLVIYDNRYPVIFSEGDFVIVSPNNVLGIIEVKTKIPSNMIPSVLDSATANGALVGKHIFNGIFIYDESFELITQNTGKMRLFESLIRSNGYINYISFGKDHFIKYWHEQNPVLLNRRPCYSFYRIVDFSFSYFISNLIEDSYNLSHAGINPLMQINEFSDYLYSIQGGKETGRIHNLELEQE